MSQVETDVRDRVAVVTLRRPERRNALSLELATELTDAVTAAGGRADVHAVVITGSGGAFCAGADRAVLADADATKLRAVYGAFHAVRACPVPTVAAIDGPAVGAGFNLALAADLRLVTPGALLDSRFLAIPVHPGGAISGCSAGRRPRRRPRRSACSASRWTARPRYGTALPGRRWPRPSWSSGPGRCARGPPPPRALVVRTKASWRTVQALPDLASASELELREQLASMDTPEYRAALGGTR